MAGSDEAFRALAQERLGPGTKGLPALAGEIALGDIGRQGWNLLGGDLPMPVAVLKDSAIDTNDRWMRAFLAERGLLIAPHGKTTMAPQLFRRQVDGGAWGITVATVPQMAVCRRFGFDRLVIANQVVADADLDYLLAEIDRSPGLDVYLLVDSIAGVERLRARGARWPGAAERVQLLLEVGIEGGRSGCRTPAGALDVARAVRASGLTLRGVEGFEGILTDKAKVDAFLDFLCATAKACAEERLFAGGGPVILSAGGSAFFDRAAAMLAGVHLPDGIRVVLRSGCYLTHDSLMIDENYRALRQRAGANLPEGDFVPALEVWSVVQSQPEPGLGLVVMGRRDVGNDSGFPVPLAHFRPGRDATPSPAGPDWRVTGLNDQHGYLRFPPDADVAVGDLVGFGISHPCTTFDKWQLMLVVDDAYGVTGAVRTFF